MRTRTFTAMVATAALSLMLVGTGLYASFSDQGAAGQNANVGTFGIELSSTTVGATVSSDKHSVTFHTPKLLSSAAGSAPLQFSVLLVGSIPATIGVTQSALSAPFSSTLAAPVADVLLHQGESHVYDAGIAWTELGNANLGQTAAITYTVAAREGPPRAGAIAPTVVQKTCNANDGGINIPGVVGIDYSIAGSPAAGGFHQRNVGTYAVTAAAQPGYDPILDGYPAGGWSLNVVEQSQCVAFTSLSATTYSWNGLGSKVAGPAPVVDMVAHTITYVIPINTAATPAVSGIIYTGPSPIIGNYLFATASPATVAVLASATVSPSLTAQANKFTLVYRTNVYGISFGNVGTLDVAAANLTALGSRHNGGSGPSSDNVPGVMWSGVTGTGSVTIVLSFTATH